MEAERFFGLVHTQTDIQWTAVLSVLYTVLHAQADNFSEQGQRQNAGIAGFFKSSLGAGFSLVKKSGYKMRS